MSSVREQKLSITDESGDVLEVQDAGENDEDVDWSDDNEAILAAVKINASQHVNLNRADLRELRDFLSEVLEADDLTYSPKDDE